MQAQYTKEKKIEKDRTDFIEKMRSQLIEKTKIMHNVLSDTKFEHNNLDI